jgi:hypothetical protein
VGDVAEAVSRSTGTEVKSRNVTPEELKADLVAKGGLPRIWKIPHREQEESKLMPVLSGVRSVIFPTRDLQASITAWTHMLGNAPAYQTPDFAVFPNDVNGVEIGLSAAPLVDLPLVYWKVDDIEEAHRALVASGAKAMGVIADGSVAELGTAPVTTGDPTTGILDVPGRRIAALQLADGALIAILQETGPRK